MTNDAIFELLFKSIWGDRFFTKMVVLDHIRECLEKDNHLKATNAPKTDIGYKNLDKELMDLKIMLDLYFRKEPDLLSERLKRILEASKITLTK